MKIDNAEKQHCVAVMAVGNQLVHISETFFIHRYHLDRLASLISIRIYYVKKR